MLRRLIAILSIVCISFSAKSDGTLDIRQGATYSARVCLYQDSGGSNPGDILTGETLAAGEIFLSKNGANSAAKNDSNNCTEDTGVSGCYLCQLNATDTGTIGSLEVTPKHTGAVEISKSHNVLEASTYDAKFTNGFSSQLISTLGGFYGTVTSVNSITQIEIDNGPTTDDALADGNWEIVIIDASDSSLAACRKTITGYSENAGTATIDYDSPCVITVSSATPDIVFIKPQSSGKDPSLFIQTVVENAGQTTFGCAGCTNTDADSINGGWVKIVQKADPTHFTMGKISDYKATGGSCTGGVRCIEIDSATPLAFTIANGDLLYVMGGDAFDAASTTELVTAIWDKNCASPTASSVWEQICTNIPLVLADTNELQQDNIPGALSGLNNFDPSTDTVAQVATVTGDVSVDDADVRGAVGLTSANLDTQLAALPTVTELAALLVVNSTTIKCTVNDAVITPDVDDFACTPTDMDDTAITIASGSLKGATFFYRKDGATDYRERRAISANDGIALSGSDVRINSFSPNLPAALSDGDIVYIQPR